MIRQPRPHMLAKGEKVIRSAVRRMAKAKMSWIEIMQSIETYGMDDELVNEELERVRKLLAKGIKRMRRDNRNSV